MMSDMHPRPKEGHVVSTYTYYEWESLFCDTRFKDKLLKVNVVLTSFGTEDVESVLIISQRHVIAFIWLSTLF